jgi:hypothetical protein
MNMNGTRIRRVTQLYRHFPQVTPRQQSRGCSDEEYKAYWATRSIPAPHDKTLLESLGLRKESTADEYCALFDRYLAGGWDYKEFHAELSILGRMR